jgi:4a-hydroxytetrahydrobiopterin dehydratase
MAVAKLTDAERKALSTRLPDWHLVQGRDAIERSFTFADFKAAFAFMTQVALVAERQDHHPEWFNVWNRVDVTLATHDAGGLSLRDIALAEAVDKIATSMGAKA